MKGARTPRTASAKLAWLRLTAICGSLLLEGLSLSGVSVQLGDIGRSLDVGPGRLQWVMIAFPGAYAGLLLAGGLSADRLGPRRVFLTGMGVFCAGSLVAVLAPQVEVLTLARVLQGAGAALTTPAAVSLIAASFPVGRARNRVLGWFSAMGAVGFALGVLLVGALTEWYGWRLSFLVFVVSSLFLGVVGHVSLREGDRLSARPVPWAQAALGCLSLVSFLLAIEAVGRREVPTVVCALSVGVALLLGVRRLNARSRCPGALPEFEARRSFLPVTALSGSFAAISGAMFLVSVTLTDAGFTPLEIGMVFLPQGIAVAVLSTVGPRWMRRSKPDTVVLTGLLFVVVGLFCYGYFARQSFSDHLLTGTILVGVGIGLVHPACTVAVSIVAEAEGQAFAAGVLATGQQMGSSIGVAAAATVYGMAGDDRLDAGLLACLVLGVMTALACVTIGMRTRRRVGRAARRTPPGPPSSEQPTRRCGTRGSQRAGTIS